MKKINVTITGALGRMGRILINRISKNKNFKLISLTDLKDGKKIKGIKIQSNNLEAFKETDVIIDFSRPKSSIEILNFAKKLKKKVVIGTTGFTKKDENIIKNYSKKIAIFKSGNMSLGINLLEYITKILSKKIPNNYQIGISDNHHQAKIDYPSGTALMLANAVAKGKDKNLDKLKGKLYLNKKGDLQNSKVNFFITRKGKTVGKHSVIYNNKIENIELKHTAFSRELFADGALNAAIWISKKNKGLFNMQDMFNLK
ncbi:4-hydroxy-tetrahydrodipicolinate reductase [Candidatus Fonsibacter ubiquis]|uniref:4-hydroxy-tetrahydrodipicolinate reductase n=1 Tax=Candidatus Fonsibacter ubiquis TaxID=1925548 RepID=UPI000C07C4B6|nr:4-hydroxy-tetrahydrodipicolinate reductase [Candidatus Fonsibacter ubiquis]